MKNRIIKINNIHDIINAIGEASLTHYVAETNEVKKAFYLGMLNVAVALETIDETHRIGTICFDYGTVKRDIDKTPTIKQQSNKKEPEVLDNQISMQDYLPELFEKLDKLIKKLDKKKE